MQVAPLLLGGAIFAAVAGAVTGTAMQTTPIRNHSSVADIVPRHIASKPSYDLARKSANLPDQYAMITPEGRIEVEELAMRGRYAGQRDELFSHIDPLPDDIYLEEREYGDEPGFRPAAISAPQREPVAAPVAPALAINDAPRAPLDIRPSLPAQQNYRGGPKVIDVAAEIAARN